MNATADQIKEFFTSEEWDMIYNLVGHGLDDDEENSETVYDIRNKIHTIFDYNDWHLQLHRRWYNNFRTGWYHLHWYHYCYCIHSLL